MTITPPLLPSRFSFMAWSPLCARQGCGRIVGIAAAGFGVLLFGAAASPALGDIRVLEGGDVSAIEIPMNNALILKSDTSFSDVSLANPDIADASIQSDDRIYVRGSTPGRTTLMLQDGGGEVLSNVNIQVFPDVSELKERLAEVMPDENIEVRTANDGVILSGVVSSIDRIERAIELTEQYSPGQVSNFMSVGGRQQVMLHVRFAEIQRSVREALGGSMQGGISPGNFDTGIRGGGRDTIPDAGFGAGDTFNLGFVTNSVQLTSLIEALESRGMARTLAEPNLVALSGADASFLAGGEFPVATADGEGGVTVDFKPFGVELDFAPTVLRDDVINLEMRAAVSGVDGSRSQSFQPGVSVEAFNRRETSTTVEMRDGESFAIAGLLQDDFRADIDETPWFADIPIIGELFTSSEYVREQTELVIIVTPYLATPRDRDDLNDPTSQIRIDGVAGSFLGDATERNAPSRSVGGQHGYAID